MRLFTRACVASVTLTSITVTGDTDKTACTRDMYGEDLAA